MYRLNPFIHVYRKDGVTALFNPLNLAAFYCGDNQFKTLFENPDSALVKEHFLVGPDFNARKYFIEETELGSESTCIGVAYFLLTSACNYQCKYCFVESRMETKPQTFMNRDIADKAIELLKRNIQNHTIDILFYGGEPLLHFDILRYIVEEIERSKLDAVFSIITNGSIMSEPIAMFIKQHNIHVTISLDGHQDINDTLRIDNRGNGTYEKVISTIEKLKKHGIEIGISCTLSSHNKENTGDIIPILEKYKIRAFGYNLPADNANISFNEDEKTAIIKNMLASEDIVFRKKILEDRIINRRLKAFVEKRVWSRDCAAYRNQIVISPDGKIGICHGLWPDYINFASRTYFDLDVSYEGKIIEHPTWKEWFNRNPLNMPKCWTCAGIGLCGGGCAKNALLRKGSIWEIDDDICLLMQESIPWIIWKYYECKVKPAIG